MSGFKPLRLMSREERVAQSRMLSTAAEREMASWEGKIKAERKESEGRFRAQWQEKKAIDKGQSNTRGNMCINRDAGGAHSGTGGGGGKVDAVTAAKLSSMLRNTKTRDIQPKPGVGTDQTGEGNLFKRLGDELKKSEINGATNQTTDAHSFQQDLQARPGSGVGTDQTGEGNLFKRLGDELKKSEKNSATNQTTDAHSFRQDLQARPESGVGTDQTGEGNKSKQPGDKLKTNLDTVGINEKIQKYTTSDIFKTDNPKNLSKQEKTNNPNEVTKNGFKPLSQDFLKKIDKNEINFKIRDTKPTKANKELQEKAQSKARLEPR